VTDAAAWIGRVGAAWAQEHARTERAFAGVAAVLDAAIAARAPERGQAVDVGCGVGSTALALAAARPRLDVTAVDLSEALLGAARLRDVEGRVRFVAGDVCEVAPGIAPLDLLVSRHGVMFFADPLASFGALRASAAPGAPLVFSCFRARGENDWASSVDAALGIVRPESGDYVPGPFAFAGRAFVTDLLTRAGWMEVALQPHDVAYTVGVGADAVGAALAFYRRIGPAASVLAAADVNERATLEARLADLFAARIRNDAVTFTAAIWVVTARAQKEVS
jgi:SAM-dependent methyltransferase